MNRIYQGKITRVEKLKADKNGKSADDWEPFDPDTKAAKEKWQAALWQHHELFQDAVNYYTLALAAMAEGLKPDTAEGKAVLEWRKQVSESWITARRKAEEFDGPHKCIARLLMLAPDKTDFDTCAVKILRQSPSSREQRANALVQLLEEANKGDLNQVCVARLPWLCTAYDKLDATPKSISQQQERKMVQSIRRIHEVTLGDLAQVAENLDVGCFLTQPPKNDLSGDVAIKEAEHQFTLAVKKATFLKEIEDEFKISIQQQVKNLRIPKLRRKPKGAYPFALLFKLFPVAETWKALKEKTAGVYKRALTQKGCQKAVSDFLAEARTKQDQPLFDYFSNIAFKHEQDNKDRAVWFDFDLVAFIEAIKSPHRYFQDTLKREKATELLRKQKLAMEGRGGEVDEEREEDDEGGATFGFERDDRITLLRGLVKDTLGYIAEAEGPTEEVERSEYTIQERTLRGFEEIKAKWRKLADKREATQEKLLAVLAEQQAKRRDDFGSATLYRALAGPKFHPIWRDAGTEKWHAVDPLKAWQVYKELCFELKDKERPIRFTPAHSTCSPRFFIFPKKSAAQSRATNHNSPRLGLLSRHEQGRLSFTSGIILGTDRSHAPAVVRIYYAAPRLCRDRLRSKGDSNLYEVPWVQPMMDALGLNKTPERVNFANCRVTLQPSLPTNIQLTFPIKVGTEKIEEMFGYRRKWDYRISGKNRQMNCAQFNYSVSEPRSEVSLRWPSDIEFAKKAGTPRKSEPVPWYKKFNIFYTLAVDLGQRDAGAFARLIASCHGDFGKKPSRFIGETNDKQWRAALERSGLFRLPGEDAKVWREISELDKDDSEDSGKSFDFRQEFWGERGRPARDWEAADTATLMRLLEVPPENKGLSLLPEDWCDSLSFPEQNDILLIAMRRYQSRIAQLHRWCWFLKGDDKQKETARREISECDDQRLITPELKALIDKSDTRGLGMLESQLRNHLKSGPDFLIRIANRILPLRGRSWHWEKHPSSTEKNMLYTLTQNGPSVDSKQRPVWLQGQRGLSMERIEQIEELRKRFQSLNQMLRRAIGGKSPIRRDESVPDPCPDLLEKLDNLKEQRVNQTAHMILAEALGLRLAQPPSDKKKLKREKDQHGVYEKILDKSGKWICPVDFIVIEDLSRYRASQGRSPRENRRLMKWCHRAVRDKLKQLCEVFGLPVLETPAAYSSRFCSRSGVVGFRAVEVSPGFEKESPWSWLKDKKDGDRLSQEAQEVQKLINSVNQANHGRDGKDKKYRTFLAPLAGGPIFVPIVEKVKDAEIQPAVVQADINAAINLGLRAVADPRLWSIHPRLRTEHIGGGATGTLPVSGNVVGLKAREKRKYGGNGPKLDFISSSMRDNALKNTRNPNYFRDFAGIAQWGFAELADAIDPIKKVELTNGKALWSAVKEKQWERVEAINSLRLEAWKKKVQEATVKV